MKFSVPAFIILVSLVAPAAATEINFETFTCAQYTAQSKAMTVAMWYWMDGQIHGASGDSSFDPSQIKDLVNGINAACKEQPDEPVLALYEDLSK